MSILIIVCVIEPAFEPRAARWQMWGRRTAVGGIVELITPAGLPRGVEPTLECRANEAFAPTALTARRD